MESSTAHSSSAEDLKVASQKWVKALDAASTVGDRLNSTLLTPKNIHTPQVYKQAYQESRTTFEDDFVEAYKILRELTALPQASDPSAIDRYRELLADRLDGMQGQKLPSISAFRAAYYHMKGFPAPQDGQEIDKRILASFCSTILATITNKNAYHGNGHFREIPIVGTILVESEMKYAGAAYSMAEIAEILISHDGHDIFHTGRNNTVQGKHEPCFMEERSFNALRPYLEACGLSEQSIDTIATAIWATEAAPDPALKSLNTSGPFTRSQLAAAAYDHHFNGGQTPNLPPDMCILLNQNFSPELVFASASSGAQGQAKTVGERVSRISENMRVADIFASLLRFKSFQLRYNQLHNENPELYPKTPDEVTPQMWKGFVQFVLGGKTVNGNFVPGAASKGANTLVQDHLIKTLFPPPVVEPPKPAEP